MSFSERLLELIGEGSRSAFARKCGVSETSIRQYLSGTMPALDTASKIAAANGVSLVWLATGEGAKSALAQNVDTSVEFSVSSSATYDAMQFTMIPRLDTIASAGSGAIADQEEPVGLVAFRAEWLHRRGINPTAARALTARGDSMEPTIRSGDILLVDTSKQRVEDNGIYVVVSNGYVQVKRIHPRQNGAVVLISDNTIYPAEEIPASEAVDFRVAGRVMWFGRSI